MEFRRLFNRIIKKKRPKGKYEYPAKSTMGVSIDTYTSDNEIQELDKERRRRLGL